MTKRVRGWMLLTLGAVAMVMAIACLNVANLLLTRTTVRWRDLAVRASLGAGRGHIAQGLLVEGILLSLTATGGALALGHLALVAITPLMPDNIARAADIAINGRVLAAALGMSLATAVVLAIVPAWTATRVDIMGLLRDGTGASAAPSRRRWRNAFLVAQCAFVIVLLTATTLLVTSFVRVVTTDLGFRRTNIVSVRFWLPYQRLASAEAEPLRAQAQRDIMAEVRGLPNVTAASRIAGGPLPLLDGSAGTTLKQPGDTTSIAADYRRVGAGYFSTTEIPLRAGREFGAADETDGAPVAVLDELAATRLFGSIDIVGRLVQVYNRRVRVIGIAQTVRLQGAEGRVSPQVYLPLGTNDSASLVVRTNGPTSRVLPQITEIIRRRSATATIRADDVDAQWRTMTADRRFSAATMSVLGLAALIIGAIGTYGVTASVVAQRRKEIGVRIALGASTRRVMHDILGQSSRLLGTGIALGLAGSFGISRLLTSLLFGVQPGDAVAWLTPALLLFSAGLVAALGPARGAARIDPIRALHDS
jgi:predicted permease